MKEIVGFDLISEAGEAKKLPAGAYICKILNVIDVPEKEYLDVYFDIVDGEYKDYFTNIEKFTGKKYGRTGRSYKETALKFFKSFLTRIEESNPGYKWDWNEKALIGKIIVVVFGEEEYLDSNADVKVSVNPVDFRSLTALREGKIKLPEIVKLDPQEIEKAKAAKNETESVNTSSSVFGDNDLPF